MAAMDKPTEIPHVLACDVGNSAVKFAAVCGDTVTETSTCAIGDLAGLGEQLAAIWKQMPAPKFVVAASVNSSACKALEAAAKQSLDVDVRLIGRDIPLPMDTDLPNPQSVGVDRLCAAIAAYDRLGDACVIADFGTAITIDCVNDRGVFLGGAILPGLAMAAGALHETTAQLPTVEISEPPAGPGKDTADAIRTGVLAAARGALRHCAETFANATGHWPLVICTGGDADLVIGDLQQSDLVQAIVPDLILRGVAMALYRTMVR